MKIKKILILIFLITQSSQYKNSYEITDAKFTDDQKSHFEAYLKFNGELNIKEYEGISFQNTTKLKDDLISNLKLNIDLECDEIIHIKITDSQKKRWDPSLYTISNKYKDKISKCKNTKSLLEKGFSISYNINKTSFSYQLIYNNETILNSNNTNFLFTNKFIVFGSYLTSNDIFGFGERYHDLNLNDGIYTIWPNDSQGIHEDIGLGGDNLMGHQPIGFHKSKNGNFLGIIFNNVNAQDFLIKSIKDDNVLFEHRTIGGIIDYYIYPCDNIDNLLIKLHDIIGQPSIKPYWAFGYHQSKWGYQDINEMRRIIQNFKDYNLQIDTFWNDIEILDNKKIFTIDTKFSDLPLFIKELHNDHYKYIPIVDIGFVIDEKYPYYIKGHNENAFIISNYTKKEMSANVWGGPSSFPDFFTDQAKNLWSLAMKEYYNILSYDGIWLDMNEPATIYLIQNCRVENLPSGMDFDDKYNEYEYLPYIPGYKIKERIDIRSNSISENSYSVLYNETNDEKSNLITYNFKPLINLLQTEETYKNLIKLNKKKPFILSRSTTLGTGKFSSHWLGDNSANYNDMKNSISGIFQFNIYGIPFTGDDICGFEGNSNDNLCARWMSLGSFYPFCRNHRTLLSIVPHEPFSFGIDSNTFKISKISLKMRYSLIRYFYSELFKISIGESGSFFKPVFFNFDKDYYTYLIIDNSAMIGNAFILFPIFSESEDNILAYFPNDDWNFFSNFSNFINKDTKKNEGSFIELPGDYKNINIFLRGGFIIPYQDTWKVNIRNTFDLQNNPTQLIVNVDSVNHFAQGDIIFDNEDYDTIDNKDYLKIHFEFMYDVLNFGIDNNFVKYYNFRDIYLSKIVFLRMRYLNDKNFCMMRITLINKGIYYAKVNFVSDDFYEVDLSKFNLRFNQIINLKFIDNNEYLKNKKIGIYKRRYFE